MITVAQYLGQHLKGHEMELTEDIKTNAAIICEKANQLIAAMGKDKKQYMSRSALGELVALFATTSGYLGVVTVRPQDYETATLVYGGLWVVRGGYSTYLRSKTK